MKNTPYFKLYTDDADRALLNPITKERPYLHMYPTTEQLAKLNKKKVNNKKGFQVVIFNKTDKSYVEHQLIPFVHVRNGKPKKFKRIEHYVPYKRTK